MAKKVDEHIKILTSSVRFVTTEMVMLNKLNDAVQLLFTQMESVFEKFNARAKVLGSYHADDAELNKLGETWNALEDKVRLARKKREAVREKFDGHVDISHKHRRAFEKYLNDREKSKSPFKDKKATAKGKDFIKTMDGVGSSFGAALKASSTYTDKFQVYG